METIENGLNGSNDNRLNDGSNELTAIIKKGKSQGYLTYEDVTSYLPDEAVGAEKLDRLIARLLRLNLN